jgi:predicted dehydrogenase
MQRLRAGVIGLGLGRTHARTYQEADVVEHLVVCDRSPEALDRARNEMPKIAACYADAAQMFASEQLDIVSILSPDHYHRPHAELAFAHGCHVLLTKPIATNLADARAVIKASERAHRKLMIAQERRFRKAIQTVKGLIDAGTLGEIILVRVDGYQYAKNKLSAGSWYADPVAGRTVLTGSGNHQVDLLLYLTGKTPRSVTAFGNGLGELTWYADKTVSALYQFDGGAIGQASFTYESTPGLFREDLRILGSKGAVNLDRWKTRDSPEIHAIEYEPNAIHAASARCVHSFIDSVLTDRPVAISGEEAFLTLAAGIAADQSCVRGATIDLTGAEYQL